MKKAVIYARYSSDRQTEQSIEGQLRECTAYAEKNDILIVNIYTDHAMTGTNDNRPAFQQMLSDSSKPVEWDIVLVYAIDRFGRDSIEIALNKYILKKNKKTLISATQRTSENIDGTKNLDGILLENMYIGLAEYYSAELSQKTKRGLNESRLKGHFCGGVINYGYSLTPVFSEVNGKHIQTASKVIINEEEAAIVNEIFTRYANGDTVYKIAKDLNARGLKNRNRPFLTSTLYTMLNREKYTGIYRVDNKVYDKLYPPIVPVDIYDIVRKRMHENSVGKHIPDVSYLLRGKLDCGYCGKRLSSTGGRDRYKKQWRYYKCYGTKGCEGKSIRKDFIENIVIDTLNKALSTDENIELIITAILVAIDKKNMDIATLRLLEKELEKTEKAIFNIMTAIKMGIITETTKESLEECEKTKRVLTEKIYAERAKEKPKPSRDEIRKYIRAALTKQPKQMIDLLIHKVVVFNEKIEIVFKYIKGSPTDERPKKLNKHITKNMNSDTNRGSFFKSYDYSYFKTEFAEYDKPFTAELYI
jgi:DNA invertase Pin-like site-specific DNA recombinase